MAIYISGVKGLPEQVQENKENIKTIQEEIEGIDFDAIRELEEQVAENTQDINNMEGTIGTQNIAITNLSGRADTLEGKVATLENKTQEITYDDVNNATNIQDVKMQDAEAHTLSITADNYGITNNVMQSKDNKGAIVLATNDNPITSLINKASGTTHSFDLYADGSVEVDGQPIGKSYYMHHIRFVTSTSFYYLDIINTDSTPFTESTLRDYIMSKTNNFTFTSSTPVSDYQQYPFNLKYYNHGSSDTTYLFCIYGKAGDSVIYARRSGGTEFTFESITDAFPYEI